MKFQILVDSSSDMNDDYLKDSDIGFKSVPLHIYIGEQEFIDDKNLDTSELMSTFYSSKEKAHTACPSPEAWLQYFDDAEYTFIVTMTDKLSGTYNSAEVAKKSHKNKKNIYVFNSKATSGSLELIVDEIVRLINLGTEFKDIVKQVEHFITTRNLFFILHRFDNLVANGRMSKFAGFMAKTLVIKPICSASKEGTIDIVHKSIGSLSAYKKLVDLMLARCEDYKNRKLIITHNNNQEDASTIKNLLLQKCKFKDIIIKAMRGLTSFYAQDKGLILCY